MSDSTLKLIHTIFRHGERTPDRQFQYPNDPYIAHDFDPFGEGQLTNIGRKTMYDLGLILRETYNEFLGETYMPKYVDGLSSDYDRAKTSMQLVLASLFTPKGANVWCNGLNWQPIPFKTNQVKDDDIVLVVAQRPDFLSAYNKLFQDGEGADFVKKHQAFFDYLKKHSGKDVKNTREAWLMSTVLYTAQEFGLPLPDWTKKVHPEKLMEMTLVEYRMQTSTKELKRIVYGKLMQKMLLDSKAKLNDQSQCKIHLYSAHDTNIAVILHFFGTMYPHIPNYGSCIVLEVHEDKHTSYLKLRYRESKTSDFKYLNFPNGEDRLTLGKFETMVEDLFNES